jgi:hypothetical protein
MAVLLQSPLHSISNMICFHGNPHQVPFVHPTFTLCPGGLLQLDCLLFDLTACVNIRVTKGTPEHLSRL